MKNDFGYTFIELVITIAIFAILSTVAVPNIITYRNNQQVNRGAREVYSALQSAKMSAIRNNTEINVLFTPGQGNAGTFQVFEDVNDNDAVDAGEEIASGHMPVGVTMQSATFAGTANATRFTRLGLTTGENGTVTVTNGNRIAQVVVNTVGGIRID